MIQIFGDITPPPGVKKYIDIGEGEIPGLLIFLNNLVKFMIVIAGLYAFINIILAGYGFMSAGNDPKKIEAASSKIWQSLVGLLIIAGAFVLAAIFGQILFGDPRAILEPKIYVPTS